MFVGTDIVEVERIKEPFRTGNTISLIASLPRVKSVKLMLKRLIISVLRDCGLLKNLW